MLLLNHHMYRSRTVEKQFNLNWRTHSAFLCHGELPLVKTSYEQFASCYSGRSARWILYAFHVTKMVYVTIHGIRPPTSVCIIYFLCAHTTTGNGDFRPVDPSLSWQCFQIFPLCYCTTPAPPPSPLVPSQTTITWISTNEKWSYSCIRRGTWFCLANHFPVSEIPVLSKLHTIHRKKLCNDLHLNLCACPHQQEHRYIIYRPTAQIIWRY